MCTEHSHLSILLNYFTWLVNIERSKVKRSRVQTRLTASTSMGWAFAQGNWTQVRHTTLSMCEYASNSAYNVRDCSWISSERQLCPWITAGKLDTLPVTSRRQPMFTATTAASHYWGAHGLTVTVLRAYCTFRKSADVLLPWIRVVNAALLILTSAASELKRWKTSQGMTFWFLDCCQNREGGVNLWNLYR